MMAWHGNAFLIWWRHQMETFSALLAICAGNSPVCGEFPTQRLVTRSFDVFFDLRPNKRLSKQSKGWWFETLSRPLWRHRNDYRPTVRRIRILLQAFAEENPNFNYRPMVRKIRIHRSLLGFPHKNSNAGLLFLDWRSFLTKKKLAIGDAMTLMSRHWNEMRERSAPPVRARDFAMRPWQNDHHFQMKISNSISCINIIIFSFKFNWNVLPKAPLTINKHWFG